MTLGSKIESYSREEKGWAIAKVGVLSASFAFAGKHITHLQYLGSIEPLPAIGFALITKGISLIATPHFSKITHNKVWLNSILSNALGGATAYALFTGLSSLGYVVMHITIPSAITLTILSIVLALFSPPSYVEMTVENKWRYKGTLYPNGSLKVGELIDPTSIEFRKGLFEESNHKKLITGTSCLKYGSYASYMQFEKGKTVKETKVYDSDHREVEREYDGQGKVKKAKIKDKDGNLFEGTIDSDERPLKGSGVWVSVDGNRRAGTFEDGRLKQGRIDIKNGDYFDGTFDLIEAPVTGEGSFKDKDDTLRKGIFETGFLKKGLLELRNGDFFEGTFAYGRPLNGKGKDTTKHNGILSFEGNYKEGRVNQGIIHYENGDHFNGLLDEQMKPVLGKGKLTHKSNINRITVISEGDFVTGNIKIGTVIYYQGDIATQILKTLDGGQFNKNRELEGPGILIDEKEVTYEGTFENGRKIGEFKITEKNGDVQMMTY